MFRRGVSEPELVPVLSRGKHRNPRKGACFMEMASYLAGEPWSDHPACTHPLLAAMARGVNDLLDDDAPHARDWARHFVTLGATDSRSFGKRSAPAIVESALAGISESTAHRNDVLVALLERTIMLCRERFGTGTAVPDGLPAQV